MKRVHAGLGLVAATLAGCSLDSTNPSGAGGSGGAAGTSTSTASSTGSQGTGGAQACAPGAIIDCYTGAAGTDVHLPCTKGKQTCLVDGSAFGPCVGEVVPSPEDCATGEDSDCDGMIDACTGDVGWAMRYGANQPDVGRGVAIDSMGNVVLTGSFQGAVTFGATTLTSADNNGDVFVLKLDPAGTVLWARGFSGNGFDQGTSVAIDAQDNVVVAGNFEQVLTLDPVHSITNMGGKDGFVAKMTPGGVVTWVKAVVSPQDAFAESVAVDASGNVLVGGRFRDKLDVGGPAQFTAGGEDGYVVKLDPAGVHIWSKQIADTGSQDQAIDGVTFDGLGNAYATGRARGDVDFGAGVVKNQGGLDLVLVKYKADGTLVSGALFGDGPDQAGLGVRGDANGNVYLTGRLDGSMQFPQGPILAAYGTADVFVAKLDADGVTSWAQHFGGFPTDTLGQSVGVDAFGNVVLCGTTSSNSLLFGGAVMPLVNKGSSDGWVAKLDQTGKALWARTLGGSGGDRCWSVAVRGDTIAVTGEFNGSASFGSATLDSAGNTDVFAASLAP